MSTEFFPISILAVLVCGALPAPASAQVHEEWSRTHDGAPMQDDFANAVAVGSNGNVYVTGRSFGLSVGIPPPPPTQDIETVAYDSAGTVLWSKRYDAGNGGDDQGHAVAVSPQGDVYVAGQSAGYVGPNYVTQQTVIKYAPDGTQSWARQYGNTAGPNTARAILVDAQGDVYVGGQDGGPNNSGDMCVRKLDPLGNVAWTALFDGTHAGTDFVYSIALAPNGDVVAAGYTGWALVNDQDIALMRVDPAGTVLFGREVFSLAGTDAAFDVAVDAAGNAYAAGYFTNPPQGQNLALVAWDAAGNHLWTKDIEGGSNGNDAFLGVAADPFGRVVAAGRVTHTATGTGQDWSVRVLDAAGNPVWDRTFDGAAHLDDLPRGLVIDALGNIHVAGSATTSASPSHTHAVAVGYDPRGDLRYVHAHAGPAGTAGERFIDAAQGPGASLALAGYADGGAGGSYDFFTVRLDRTAVPYCFGDGSGTACPCGNASAAIAHSGCLSSLGIGGRLIDSGASSLSADTFVLQGSDMPSSSALYFQGTNALQGGAGVVFGDGLRCVSGTIARLATKLNAAGASQYPVPGDLPVSVRGGVVAPGVRTYQVWYRNAAAFCTASTFNLTNGLRVTWVP